MSGVGVLQTPHDLMRRHLSALSETIISRKYLYRKRWRQSSNLMPVIEALAEAGLMQRASGEFAELPPSPGDAISLFGRSIPVVGVLVSLHKLTALGEEVLADIGGLEPEAESRPAEGAS